jgi:carboxypeptidase-like protein
VIRVLCSTIALLACASFSAAQQAGSGTGRLRGRVLTGVDSSPLAGAIVFLDNGRVAAVTDSIGSFAIDTVAVGVHSLNVRYIQYHDSQLSITITPDVIDEETIVLQTHCQFDSLSAIDDTRHHRPKIVFNEGIAPSLPSRDDIIFERKYGIRYVILGDEGAEPEACVSQNNRIVFRFLDRRFGTQWRTQVRQR